MGPYSEGKTRPIKIKLRSQKAAEDILYRTTKLEYAEVVWSPHKKKHIKKLERIQKMATKMVPELKGLTHAERLKETNLTTLE